MKGYIENGLLDLPRLKERHDELVIEMKARGYNHRSPLEHDFIKDHVYAHEKVPDFDYNVIDLATRCPDCAQRLKEAGIIVQCPQCKAVEVTNHGFHVLDEMCLECEQIIQLVD